MLSSNLHTIMKVQGVICIFLVNPVWALFWMQDMQHLLRDMLPATKAQGSADLHLDWLNTQVWFYIQSAKSACQYEDISKVCGSTKIWWRAGKLWTFKPEDRISHSETIFTSLLSGVHWCPKHSGSWGSWFHHLFTHHLTFGKSGGIPGGGFLFPTYFRITCQHASCHGFVLCQEHSPRECPGLV